METGLHGFNTPFLCFSFSAMLAAARPRWPALGAAAPVRAPSHTPGARRRWGARLCAAVPLSLAKAPKVRRRVEIHDPEQRQLELMRLPDTSFRLDGIGDSWEDYYALRGFVPQNRAACTGALSVPLTILSAIRSFNLTLEEKVTKIDLVGSRVLELANLELVYEELGRAFPGNFVHLRLVGPELNDQLPGAVDVENVRLSFHRMLYQDFISSNGPPHLAMAFHAGLQEYSTWQPALEALVQLRVPSCVTGYSLLDISQGLAHLMRRDPKMIRQGVNSFACTERLEVDEASERLSMGRGRLDAPELARLQAMVDDAGGLLPLALHLQGSKAPELTSVSLNSWWYLFFGPG
ncbi:unnamed protein product [Effrenium voratum]|nr:unnamed protein product [Effrenium voratum]